MATRSRETIDAKSRALTPAATVLVQFGAALMHGVMRWEFAEAAVTPSE